MPAHSVRDARTITDQVDGWLGKREGPYLYVLAEFASPLGAVVEIGSWKGKSTIWLAKACEAVPGARIFAIDPHREGSEQEFRRNVKMAGVDAILTPIVAPSVEALKGWDRPIGLLWIDGDHRYESVKSDFFGWEPFVVEGGVVAFHDTYSWEGVRRVVDEDVLRSDRFKVLGQVDSILAVSKVSSLSLADHVRRKTIVTLRGIYHQAREKRKHWRALPRKLLRGISVPKVPA